MLSSKNAILSSLAPLRAAVTCSSRLLTSPAPKPFNDIPGPKGLPLIGTALDYKNDKYTMSRVMKKRIDEYGPIYREAIFPGLPEQVVVYDPKDVETVFRADGEWPQRPEGGDLFHRLLKEAGVHTPGLFISQGKQWQKMRSPMAKFMMVPRKVAEYHEDFNNITEDLIKNIEMKKDPQSALFNDVPSLFFNWSFESVAFFALGRRFGSLDLSGAPPESKNYISTVSKFFLSFIDLVFSLPLYKIYRTKSYKNVVNTQRSLLIQTNKFVDEKLAEIAEEDKRVLEAASGEEEAPDKVDFITYLVHSGKLNVNEVSANIMDILSAGVETTSYTLSWALYNLATNSEAQEKLREEIHQVMGSDKIVTPAHISQMSYLRNTFKETQRLYPLAGLNQRILQNDVVLSGYSVPKTTEITIPQILIGRMSEFFSEPDKFLPERWNKENKDSLPSMFAQLPFGFGVRMCVGRRLAELELNIALTQLIRNYKVEYLDKEPMGFVQSFLIKPERQLDLVFKRL